MSWKMGSCCPAGVGRWVLVALLAALLSKISMPSRHSEEALMSDWSSPPPLPVFVGVNVLAGLLRAAADALTPPPIRMMDLGGAYQNTVLAYICSKFDIPDFLADGPKSPVEIAVHMKTSDVDRVTRLMYALAANGLTQLAPGQPASATSFKFVNTAMSATLRTDHPNSMKGMIGHQFEDMYGTWGKLPLLYGESPIETAWDAANPDYPLAEGGIWSLFSANPRRQEQFGRAMTALEGLGGQAMVEDGPWQAFDRFIDIGGNHGHFLHKLLVAHSSKRGVLFDRPPVIEDAQEKWSTDQFGTSKLAHDDAQNRVQFMPGSFFEFDSLPKAQDGDVFLMRYILHDWQDAKVGEILDNLRRVMGPTKATLLVGECALPDRHQVGVPPVMYNIDIQMMAAFGTGKERTPKDWKVLLAAHGFQVKSIHATRSLVHWVEAVPV